MRFTVERVCRQGDLISFSAPVDGIKIYPYTL